MSSIVAIVLAVSFLNTEPKSHFSTEQAAQCAVTYAFTLDVIRHMEDVPSANRREVRDGLAQWEYELKLSAPDAPVEYLQTAADEAVLLLDQALPVGQGAEAAKARGAYLTESQNVCATLIAGVYGSSEEHPVMPFLRAADAEAGLSVAPMPVSSPAEAELPQRGLR